MGENRKHTRMSEIKDPAIKLFGQTISLNVDVSKENNKNKNKNGSEGELTRENKQEDESTIAIAEESAEAVTSSVISEDIKKDDDPSESSESRDQKGLKKPDKILPCPRCNSNDTKFCYYNNYNVNQPRHFCKNCQRYWTAGGIMRNVPVGSGRRKNKSSSSSATNYGNALVFTSDKRQQSCVPNGYPENEHLMWNSVRGFPPRVPCFPVSFYTVASPWNVRWIPEQSSQMMSQTLGKHSRDGNGNVLVPKALRIEDSSEAARSSIWSTLGIKNERTDSPGARLVKAFGSKADDKKSQHVADHSWMMQANPAALSRSINFHEST